MKINDPKLFNGDSLATTKNINNWLSNQSELTEILSGQLNTNVVPICGVMPVNNQFPIDGTAITVDPLELNPVTIKEKFDEIEDNMELVEVSALIGNTTSAVITGVVLGIYNSNKIQTFPTIQYDSGISTISIPDSPIVEEYIIIYKKKLEELSDEDEEALDWEEVNVPLTFTGLDDVNTIKLTKIGNINQATIDGLQYKLDDGEWNQYIPDTKLIINKDHSVSFKDTYGNNFSQDRNSSYFNFIMTGRFNGSGNVMSLENFSESIKGGNVFARLFENCESLITAPKILCRTISSGGAFFIRMFANCTNLKKAANIYLNIITWASCNEMYRGCKSLVIPPKVYSTDTQGSDQFNGFLRECFSLKYGVDFSSIATLGDSSFANCYYGDYNLEMPGKIGVKSLRTQGNTFSQMYYACSKLKYGPELSEVTSQVISNPGTSTFYRMFQNCTNMIYGPTKLNIKIFGSSSCAYMFTNCFALTNFMDISLVEELYGSGSHFEAFYQNCYSLKEIPNNKFLQITSNLPTATFRYAFQNCISLEYAPNLPASGALGGYCYQHLFNSDINLKRFPSVLPASSLAEYSYGTMFANTQITDMPIISATTFTNVNCMGGMFQNCTKLSGIHQENLPATTLINNCYQSMFYGCTSLSSIPENFLPAIELTPYCYEQMFRACTNLTNVPKLPATTLAPYCYQSIFYGDTKLNKIEVNFVEWPNSSTAVNATNGWVYNVSPSGEFICPSGLPVERGTSRIPNNWTITNI